MNFIQTRTGKYRYEYQVGTVEGKPNARKLVVFEVYYLKGSQAKGIIAALRPTTIEQFEGYHTESFEVFQGVSVWAKQVARKSDKITAQVAKALDAVAPLLIAAYIESPEKGKAALKQAISEFVK